MKVELESIKPVFELNIHEDAITSLIWANEETLISGSYDHTVRFTDL